MISQNENQEKNKSNAEDSDPSTPSKPAGEIVKPWQKEGDSKK
ncbi:hypothetical protein Q4Q35_03510 [Flavivirga aquimarina]|uniref:Uncharacterized protein n=1 Tax=Flavivirga aquimarina TaxID=2027862 RepID=A0ABT8W6W6_9FLAO|nr:hypothetical protein [Flavivirga aquimarina]MDO5968864.1 hypothetical protein [Flavivirga aquimarina]